MLACAEAQTNDGEPTDASDGAQPTDTTDVQRAPRPPAVAPACPERLPWRDEATVDDARVFETSGLVVDPRDSDVVWVHNDSGDSARVMGVSRSTGSVLAELTLDDVVSVDAEDLAGVWDPAAPDTLWLWYADLGDNLEIRPLILLHRLSAPDAGKGDATVATETFTWRYADDRGHDAEGVFVDPADGHLYVVTKERALGEALVFRSTWPAATAQPGGEGVGTLEEVGRIDVGASEGGAALTTAADVSWDGTTIAVRTYTQVWLWTRRPDVPFAAALQQLATGGPSDDVGAPCRSALGGDGNGESLGFDPGGAGFLTLAEGRGRAVQWHAWPVADE